MKNAVADSNPGLESPYLSALLFICLGFVQKRSFVIRLFFFNCSVRCLYTLGDFEMGVLQSLESLKSTIKQQSLGDCGTMALLADDQVCAVVSVWGVCAYMWVCVHVLMLCALNFDNMYI